MNFNYELTDAQKNEFQMAEQFNGSSEEIRKHPEWHPYFMNSFWNQEKEEKGEDMYRIADYISSHPSKKDIESGKIGADFRYLHALYDFVNAAGPGIPFPDIPLNEDGQVDVTEAQFALQKFKYRFVEHREPLFTGRMPVGSDDNMEDLKILMCEGNSDVETLYDQLRTAARSEAMTKSVNNIPIRDQQQWNSFTTVLSLDDMNIRGQQILDAYEYAGESVETMINLIHTRDSKMVDYVNKKMASQYLEDIHDEFGISFSDYPLAKTSGASSAHSGRFFMADRDWNINITNAEALANTDVNPIQIDYSTLDIMDGIDTETGFKIIEAHGFEKYFERTVKSSFDDDLQVAFFYNKNNGDIVEVSGAEKNNMVYGGVTLKMWRDKENFHHGSHSSSGFDRDKGLGYIEFSHHNGLFHEYDSYNDTPVSEQTGRNKMGYQGIGEFPIPEYIKCFYRTSDLADNLKDYKNISYFYDNDYKLKWMIDMMLAAYDPEIKDDICPDYKQLKEDPYHSIMKEHGGSIWRNDIDVKAHLFQFAASWMHMPTEEREKYYNALVDITKEHDEELMERAKETGYPVDKDNINSKFVQKLSKIYLNDPKCPEDIYALGVPKVEDIPAAKHIPWLDMESLDFEAAVADLSVESGQQMGQ